MFKRFQGVVAFPDFKVTSNGKPLLRFLLLRDGDERKRVPVVVFGKLAETHGNLVRGAKVTVTGIYHENAWGDEPQWELKIFQGRGSLRVGS